MSQSDSIFDSLGIIEKKIQEKLTVASIAESIHFSKYHYQRLFRELVGDSVMRYVTRSRLLLAAKELTETDSSVLEIALKYGYDSHEGFTRSFRAHIGATPTEYRKYHASISSPKIQKERKAMLYSKTTDEIIRELNGLIVQAKKAAEYTRENMGVNQEVSTFYNPFWESIAARAEAMADSLAEELNRITSIPQRPDEISTRFRIIKAIEDIVFQSHVTVFHINLTLARAKPEHRAAFETISGQYAALAQNAQIGAGKIAAFFHELSMAIFEDMRKSALEHLGEASEKGKSAAEALSDPALPYTYIADEVRVIAEELASMSLEDVTVSLLEDFIFRLDIILFAAEADALRAPAHRKLFEGISDFKGKVHEATEFFQKLSNDTIQALAQAENRLPERSPRQKLMDMVFQWNILLFYLKGEVQKLGNLLDERQKGSLETACKHLAEAIHLTQSQDIAAAEDIIELVQEAFEQIMSEAEKLGIYGAPIQFIANEIKNPMKHLKEYYK